MQCGGTLKYYLSLHFLIITSSNKSLFLFYKASIDYTQQENWTVDCFVGHEKERFTMKAKNTKKTFWGYSLLARWKGFSSDQDTKEPLHSAAEHHKVQLVSYLKQEGKEEILSYIKENNLDLFSKEFQEELL